MTSDDEIENELHGLSNSWEARGHGALAVALRDAAALIRRLRAERDDWKRRALRVSGDYNDTQAELNEARNKALDEARMAVSVALSLYSCGCCIEATKAILALKSQESGATD